MTDDAFERDIRTMLAARDPGPAPAGLADAVRERIAFDRRRGAIARWVSSARAAAATVAIAAMFIVVLTVAVPIGPGPGASTAPDAQPPYTMQPGDGVVTGERQPLFQGLAALIAFSTLLLVAIRARGKWPGIASALGALGIAFVALTIGTSDALVFGSGTYGVTPFRIAPDSEPGMYVAVSGDQPFHLVLTVTNGSRLSLDLLGLVEPATLLVGTDRGNSILPRFVAIANLPGLDVVLSEARPFETVTIPPGEGVNIVVLGMAGTCALPAPGPDGQGGIGIEHLGLVYEQLTIVHTQDFTLPEPVVITQGTSCP